MDASQPLGAAGSRSPRSLRRRRRIACLTALVVVISVTSAPATVDARAGLCASDRSGQGTVLYRPPVEAPVTDPFRPPLTPYGPGNRGIEYATVPGASVHAAAD